MGWQSYVLLIENEEDKNRVIGIIKEHNSNFDNNLNEDMTGEDLVMCVSVKLLKSKPKKFDKYTSAIVCGNGGGRSQTFEWFTHNKVIVLPFSDQKWLSRVKEDIKELPEGTLAEAEYDSEIELDNALKLIALSEKITLQREAEKPNIKLHSTTAEAEAEAEAENRL